MGKWEKEKVCRISLFTIEHSTILSKVVAKLNNTISKDKDVAEYIPQIIDALHGIPKDRINDAVSYTKRIGISSYDKTSKFIDMMKQFGKDATVGRIIEAFEGRGWTTGVDIILEIDWDGIEGINKLLIDEPISTSNVKTRDEPDFPNDIPKMIPFDYEKAVKYLTDAVGNYYSGRQLNVTVKQAKTLMSGEKIYKMDSNPRGIAFIINNMFKRQGLHQRDGSEFDVNYLGCLFSQLGFQVFEIHNVRSDQFPDLMNRCRTALNNSMDAAVFAIMSHGAANKIEMADNKCINIDTDIVSELFNNKFKGENESFKNKPKLLIFQSCQDTPRNADGKVSHDDVRDGKYGEIHVLYPCFLQTAERQEENGTPFIYHLVDEIMKNAHECNLDQMMDNLVGTMKAEAPKGRVPQIPHHHKIGVSKQLYFNPGFPAN